MNISRRGTKQTESIVFRVTEEDKARIRVAADQRGISMSDVIKESLMETDVIQPKYTPF